MSFYGYASHRCGLGFDIGVLSLKSGIWLFIACRWIDDGIDEGNEYI